MRRRGISKDARGNEVHQVVNATDGTLTSVTDSNGQTVNYTYDESKRVTGVETTTDGKAYRNAYTYENDRIKTVAHNTTGDTQDVTYTFNYDELGRKTTVKVGSQTLSTNVYSSDRSGLLKEVQYGNDGKVKYAYDEYDRLTGVRYDDETTDRYTYEYGADGEASVVRDKNLGRVLQTERDLTQRAMGTQLRDANGNLLYRTELDYDTQNRLVGFGETASGRNYKTAYTYDNENRATEISFGGNDTVHYTYDNLGRVSNRVVENGTDEGKLTSTYEYVEGGYGDGSTTPLVQKINQPQIPFEYTYDSRGNIISEKRSNLTTTYAYDALGQLIRVNDPHENATWIYSYDRGGNILSKARYAYTIGELGTAAQVVPYAYGDANWKDKLTAYNGKSITYDAIGNPLTDGTWTYQWQAGRQLKQMTKSGTTIQFKYDHNGLRVGKVVNGTETKYMLHGKLVTHLTVGGDNLHFFYDAQSRPAKVSYNGTIYTYVHNLQGDVVGLLDNAGTLVVEYKYDAWGKMIVTTGSLAATLGACNPFRYRGYVYDEETGLYYLRSRYYNPVVGRFVNEDGAIIPGLLSTNMFAYCSNNPLSLVDTSGCRGENIFQRAGNWLSDLFNKIGDEIKYQTKIQTEVNIRMAKSADEKLSKAENWIKKKASDVGDWWNGSAKPWIEQAWEDVGKSIKDALRAQQQADILSTQMTYNAGVKVCDWFSDNWRDVVDWAGFAHSTVSVGLGITEKLVKGFTLPPPVGTAMLVVDFAFWLYEAGDKLFGWW